MHEKAFSSKINANRNSGVLIRFDSALPARDPRLAAVDYCAASEGKLPRLHGRLYEKHSRMNNDYEVKSIISISNKDNSR